MDGRRQKGFVKQKEQNLMDKKRTETGFCG